MAFRAFYGVQQRPQTCRTSQSLGQKVISIDAETLNPHALFCVDGERAGGNEPLFPGSICALTRDHRRDGAPRGVERFTPFFCFSPSFFSLILRKKSCLLAALIFLDNSRKWQPAVRKRNMTSKYGLPIVAVRWTDCDSGTPIFWSVSFPSGGRG